MDDAERGATSPYAALVGSARHGFCLLQVVAGASPDLRILEANAAFVNLIGGRDAVGTTLRSLAPGLEDASVEQLVRVAETGQSAQFETATFERVFAVHASSNAGSGIVAVMMEDITERKRLEQRQGYLLKLSDALRPLADAAEIQGVVTRTALDFFGAERCYYCEIVDDSAIVRRDAVREGVFSVAGVYPLSDSPMFKAMIGAGRPVAIENYYTTDLIDEELRQLCLALQIISAVIVPVIKQGQTVGLFCLTQGAPRNWTAGELELASETAERTWAAVERAHAEAALRDSEEKYRSLFDAIDQGVTSAEMIFNDSGKVVDYWLTDSNAAMERLTGLPPSIRGKTAREILPDLQAAWFDTWERVVKTGVSERVELEVAALGRWFDLHFSRIGGEGSRKAVAIYTNITERKRHEANLAFLAEISQDLVGWMGIEDTMNRLGEKIGGYFKLARCVFVEIIDSEDRVINVGDWAHPKLPRLVSEFPLSQFVSEEFRRQSRAGETLVVSNVHQSSLVDGRETEAAFGIISFVNVPLLRNGEWRFTLGVYDAAPRDWRADEIELVRELTTRIWTRLERARAEEALRKSEEKFRTLFETVDEGFCVQELVLDERGEVTDIVYHEANAAFERHTGLANVNGKRASEILPHIEQQWFDALRRVHRTGVPERTQGYNADTERWITAQYLRVGGGGSPFVAAVFEDITERKRAEQRQAYLLQLSDVLRPLTSPAEAQAEACRVLGEHLGASRVNYAEVEGEEYIVALEYRTEGLPTMVGRYPINSFRPAERTAFEAGRTVALTDIMAEPSLTLEEAAAYGALGVRAFVSVPLVKAGRLVVVLSVIRSRPGAWPPHEVALIEETAERTWAAVERARAESALRVSEMRLQQALSASRAYGFTIDLETRALTLSSSAVPVLGFEMPLDEAERFSYVYPEDMGQIKQAFNRALEGGAAYNVEHRLIHPKTGETVWVGVDAEPFDGNKLVGSVRNITERKQAEERLRDSEAQLRALVALAPALIWEVDPSGQIVTANARWLEYTGQRLEETQHGGWLRAIHPDDAPYSMQTFQRAFETGQALELEHRVRRFDGAYRWFLVRQEPVRAANGAITRWFGVATDIHERRAAEEARAWLAAIVESSSDAIISFDLQGSVLSWNSGAQQMFGYSASEMLGQPLTRLATPDLEPKLHALLERLGAGGTVIQRDLEHVRRGGEPFDALLTASPIRDREDRVVAATAIVQDVTARKRTERALASSEARFRAFVSQVRDHAIFSVDLDGVITSWNEGCRDVLGYEEPEFIGLNSRALFTPEDQAAGEDRQELATAARDGFASDDREMMRKDGSRFFASGATSAVRGVDGRLEGYTKVMRDLTERKRVEERLREVNEAQRRFVSDASHELRAPLMALGGNLELLRMKGLDDAERAEIVNDLFHETARLSRLVNDLLALARGDSAAPMKRERVALRGLLLEAWRLARALDGHNFVLGTLETCDVNGDADRLKQLGLILLENAVKYTPKGGTIRLESTCTEAWAEFRVSDTGPGIAPGDLERVFERFYRADKARTPGADPGGTGLGLPIARQIVEAHGGSIHLESELGVGTTAVVRLPRVE
jgi:PAS domain S-box-containing protein